MAYKDKVKQREAGRERQRRYKAKQKALLNQGVTQGVTEDGAVLPPDPEQYDLSTKRGEDIKCFADLPPDVQRAVGPMPADTYARKVPKMTVMERLFYRPAHLLKPGETNFVSLPGRACYGVV